MSSVWLCLRKGAQSPVPAGDAVTSWLAAPGGSGGSVTAQPGLGGEQGEQEHPSLQGSSPKPPGSPFQS